MSKGLLIVDDEEEVIESIKFNAEKRGIHKIWCAETVKEAFDLWKEYRASIAAVVLDLNIEKEGDGWTLLQTFKNKRDHNLDEFEVFIYSGNFDDIRPQLEAIRTQTVTLFRKGDDEDLLWGKLESLARRLIKHHTPFYFSEEEEAEMDAIANSSFPLLLIGAPGSGKTVKARALATKSGCASDRIYLINCASLTRELAEAELFGSLKGAFTGSVANTLGKMMAASGFTTRDLARE